MKNRSAPTGQSASTVPFFLQKCLAALAVVTSLAGYTGSSRGADGQLTVGTGLDYSTGSYGELVDTEIAYLAFTAKYEVDRWTAKVTLPYLNITGPSGTILVDGRPVSAGNVTSRSSESGPGDVVLSGGYSVYENAWAGIAVDAIGKMKLPTANEDKGLGSGKTDYAFQIDAFKSLASFYALGTLGYRWLGEPEALELNNVWFGSFGVGKTLNAFWSGGVLYDYREASSRSGTEQSEVTLYFSRKVDKSIRMQLYTVHGFTSGSPDWGIGGTISRTF